MLKRVAVALTAGYILDHIIPLGSGGFDSPSNMHWQTVQKRKFKTGQNETAARVKIGGLETIFSGNAVVV
jgi:hypothetical protein